MFTSMDSSADQRSPAPAGESGQAALQSQADQGDAQAQFGLALQYGSAAGVELDFTQAARWYRKAADQEHTLAQYNLGTMFARGQGVPQDETAAANWMRRAAEGGDAGGQYHLGMRCHRASVDTLRADAQQCRIEAYMWFFLAAAQGYRDSGVAQQRVSVGMSRAEVEEGNRRAEGFVVRKTGGPQAP